MDAKISAEPAPLMGENRCMEMIVAMLTLFGALNALLLGGICLARFGASSLRGRYLGLFLVCASLVMVVITIEHQGWVRRIPALYITEELLSLLYGPLVLGFVRTSLGQAAPRWPAFIPFFAYLGLLALAPLALLPSLHPPLGMENIMWVQIAYFIIAVATYLNWRKNRPNKNNQAYELSLAWMLLALLLMHVAQIVRWLFSEVTALTEVVPLTGTLFFYLFLGYALAHSRSLKAMSTQRQQPDAEGAQRLFEKLQAIMDADRPFLRRDLKPKDLAEALQCSIEDLRSALQQQFGSGFYAFVGSYRLNEAKRLLRHPDEQRYTIEGLALQCGYASRSAFYKAFKQATGQTPAEYRKQHLN